uniref:Putative secreted protein n=1 Tax=Lutzomyia longipalpis TaxID=7200 RepID=A0A1B0C833_LUTLO
MRFFLLTLSVALVLSSAIAGPGLTDTLSGAVDTTLDGIQDASTLVLNATINNEAVTDITDYILSISKFNTIHASEALRSMLMELMDSIAKAFGGQCKLIQN